MEAQPVTAPHGVTVVQHPLVSVALAALRAENTPTDEFRRNLQNVSVVLLVEASRSWDTFPIDVETPLRACEGAALARPVALVPILRAGLGMLDGVLSLIPSAKVSVIGLVRNEQTLEADTYLEKLVGNMNQRMALIIDPMLATGGSMVATIDMLKRAGAREIRALVLVAAPEGIARVNATHPDVQIYTASIDERLNEHGYIIPGLGDAGDKIFGTKQKDVH